MDQSTSITSSPRPIPQSPFEERLSAELAVLEEKGNLRSLPHIEQNGIYMGNGTEQMYNLSSNDYLGLATDIALRADFLSGQSAGTFLPSASSSRLLTGNYPSHRRLEQMLARLYGREAALVASSGYHINSGILPAIAHERMLILADKLVHASLIDGIRLSAARCIRFRHNDYEQLERLIHTHSDAYESILIVTESIFSMDGDEADLPRLAALKKKYPNLLLYVDEAHAFGIRGKNGLGCAEEQGCVQEIDFLVGTLGKALASAGAFVVCSRLIYQYLVNKMRPLIFTTALPPWQMDWTCFLLERLPGFSDRREILRQHATRLRKVLEEKGYACPSTSHIVPVMVGESTAAAQLARDLQKKGLYVLPVRPPTVPEGTSRIRISLTAALPTDALNRLIEAL